MSDSQQPTYLVSAYSDPVVVRICGKANYLNCNSFREFIEKVIAGGSSRILLDFSECKGMDSTFLGILAGTAIEMRQQKTAGELVLTRLGKRNHELIENLGLQNLLTISESSFEVADPGEGYEELSDQGVSDARQVLKAHENLAQADAGNEEKFQDVIAFLRNQVESEKST